MTRWSRWLVVWGCLAGAGCDEAEVAGADWEDTGVQVSLDDASRLSVGSVTTGSAVDVAIEESLYVDCKRLEQNACRGNCAPHKYCGYDGATGSCDCVGNNGEVGCADATAVTAEQ